MIETKMLYDAFYNLGLDFYIGTSDASLKGFENCVLSGHSLCGQLNNKNEPRKQNRNIRNITAPNAESAISIAVGYNIATNKCPVVYVSSTCAGSIVDLLNSTINENVLSFPMLILISVNDSSTRKMFEALNKKYFYIENVTNIAFVEEAYQYSIKENKPVTLLVNANILSCVNDGERKKTASLNKYDALKYILSLLDEKDFLLASHGDIAKEIYNIRKKNGQTHNNDLLLSNSHEQITSIAYGLALNSTKNIWCIDSDSTLLYNLGGTANVLLNTQRNMKYILIDDESQFSSDGQNAHLHLMDIKKMLKSMGVKNTMEAYTYEDIKIGMLRLAREKSALIIKVSRDKPLKIVQNDYDAKKNFEEFKGKFQKT